MAAVEPAEQGDTPGKHRRLVGDISAATHRQNPVALIKNRYGHQSLAGLPFGIEKGHAEESHKRDKEQRQQCQRRSVKRKCNRAGAHKSYSLLNKQLITLMLRRP